MPVINIPRGDLRVWDFIVTVDGGVVDLNDYDLFWTFKLNDSDLTPVLEKTSLAGQLVVNSGDSRICRGGLSSADSKKFVANLVYNWDFRLLRKSDGEPITPDDGKGVLKASNTTKRF